MPDFLDQYDKEREKVISWTTAVWPYNKQALGDNA